MSSFENLDVWKRSRRAAVDVIRHIAEKHPGGLRDQLIRSVVSVPPNIAEGAERQSSKEYSNFLSYASGSCAEALTQIMIASEIGMVDEAAASDWIREYREIGRMLFGLRRANRSSYNPV